MLTWLDLYPERLTHEIEALTAIGFDCDSNQLRDARRLVMRGCMTTVRGEIELTIIYPDSFPYMRPEVFASNVPLERHQNPYNGNLCLLDRNTRAWEVDMTGAWLVTERVPYLIELLQAGGETLRAGEAPQGEPASVYFASQSGTAVFMGEELLHLPPDSDHGTMQLAYGRAEAPTVQLRVAVRRVTAKGGRHGRVLAECDEAIAERFSGKRLDGRWVRLSRLPAECSPEAVLRAAISQWPELRQPRYTAVQDGQIDVTGCVFAEEVGQGEWQDGWLFLVRHRRRTGDGQARRGVPRETVYITRADRLSADDLAARIPHRKALSQRHVAVIGLGALGAPIALELARNGTGTLSLLDYDRVEAGNAVRWPVGLTAVGYEKTDVIGATILNDHPYTAVRRAPGRIGEATPAALTEQRTSSELDLLREFLAEADVIVEATAEMGVQHLVGELAGERPVIYAWGTEGAAGGCVARVQSQSGCWVCLQHALLDGTIPAPTTDEQATTQPRGCATATFTGGSFDLLPIVAQAARVTIGTLGNESWVPDISVMSLRDADGVPTSGPTWHYRRLEAHPGCASCAQPATALAA